MFLRNYLIYNYKVTKNISLLHFLDVFLYRTHVNYICGKRGGVKYLIIAGV